VMLGIAVHAAPKLIVNIDGQHPRPSQLMAAIEERCPDGPALTCS
jgi:hypothetical protein